MPNLGSNVYTGVEYRMGYVDPGPVPRMDGVLRVVTPLMTFPNSSTYVFPEVGTINADPELHQETVGWCSVNLAAPPYTFPLRFEKSGWHQFVINTTWGRPTITGDYPSTNCSLPINQQYTFFGTKAFSVAPSPTTGGLIKAAPAFTVWTDLTWKTPAPLPLDAHKDSKEQKIIVGLSIAGVFVAIGTIVAIMWLIRRRRKAARELLAISRLPPRDQAELLNRPLPVLPVKTLNGNAGMHYARPVPPTTNAYQFHPVGQWHDQAMRRDAHHPY
ncbi:hypothetical protein NCC49_002761 [Naganishia albida]|nr:hypothetical protein NCC49_002761 [Naganishia albida]